MKKRLVIGFGIATFVFGMAFFLAQGTKAAGGRPTLAGQKGKKFPPLPHKTTPRATEQLFKGDFGAEIGLGCDNSAGTTGGPNDVVVGVTATLTPPFAVTSTTYNVFTAGSANLTAMTFTVLAGGPTPGAVVGTAPGAPFALGNHTFAVSPAIGVATGQFYFGFSQPQSNAGMRWGLDTSSGSAATSYIKAPTCGLAAFATVDSIGFPGNWVFRCIIDDTIPVELYEFSVE